MYRVGGKLNNFYFYYLLVYHLDYVYFEGNPTEPYLIRRIEELNKVCLA